MKYELVDITTNKLNREIHTSNTANLEWHIRIDDERIYQYQHCQTNSNSVRLVCSQEGNKVRKRLANGERKQGKLCKSKISVIPKDEVRILLHSEVKEANLILNISKLI